MCVSTGNVDVLAYSDVFLSHKSYVYKCIQSVKQDPYRSSVFGLASYQ